MLNSEPLMPIDTLTQKPEWAQLTMAQLQKDADLSGATWHADTMPQNGDEWINHILNQLKQMDKSNPELLSRFLYRIDLPEKEGMQEVNEALAWAVLKRAFMKVWLKANYPA